MHAVLPQKYINAVQHKHTIAKVIAKIQRKNRNISNAY